MQGRTNRIEEWMPEKRLIQDKQTGQSCIYSSAMTSILSLLFFIKIYGKIYSKPYFYQKSLSYNKSSASYKNKKNFHTSHSVTHQHLHLVLEARKYCFLLLYLLSDQYVLWTLLLRQPVSHLPLVLWRNWKNARKLISYFLWHLLPLHFSLFITCIFIRVRPVFFLRKIFLLTA